MESADLRPQTHLGPSRDCRRSAPRADHRGHDLRGTLRARRHQHLRVGGSGTSPAFETPVLVAALLAMWGASAVFLVSAVPQRLCTALASVPFLWLIPVAAAALVIARAYTYDPYDLPSLVRTQQSNGSLPEVWLVIGIAAGVAVYASARRAPRVAMLINALMLFAAASTAFVATLGH